MTAKSTAGGIVAAGIEQIMQDEVERETALKATGYTIKRRMETPCGQWIEM